MEHDKEEGVECNISKHVFGVYPSLLPDRIRWPIRCIHTADNRGSSSNRARSGRTCGLQFPVDKGTDSKLRHTEDPGNHGDCSCKLKHRNKAISAHYIYPWFATSIKLYGSSSTTSSFSFHLLSTIGTCVISISS